MPEIVQVILFALLPVFGVLIGTVLAETFHAPGWLIGATLHCAAGVAIALVSIDLMPRIIDDISTVTLVVAFLAGAAASVTIGRLFESRQSNQQEAGTRQAWMVYTAVGADLASDGALTGAGTAIGNSLGFLVAASQSIANIPGGFAAASNLRMKNVSKTKRVIAAAAMILPAFGSAILAFWLLGDSSPQLKSATLAFISGVLLLATIEDVIPQGDASRPARWLSTMAFALGFTGLALLSALI